MASTNTGIEWTDCTWNVCIGCRHVAEGCRHCYAETMSKRLAAMGQKDYASILDAKGKFNGKAITRPETLAEPLRWKKPRMVFVNSMSDLFHQDVPFEFIAAVFGVMAACPQHTFQVLTKRPARALEFLGWADQNIGEPDYYARFFDNTPVRQLYADGRAEPTSDWPIKNVWLGVSVATQADADKNIPVLLKCPAAVRFVSAEPLIREVYLQKNWTDKLLTEACATNRLDWVIVGGESGPGARPCNVAWVRSIVEQCKSASVPVFVKQLGARAEQWNEYENRNAPLFLSDRKGGDPVAWDTDLRVREFPKQEAAHGA